MRRILAAAAATALVAVGVAATTAQAATVRPASVPPAAVKSAAVKAPIKWGPCTDTGLQAHKAECGMLTVPMDYARPGGRTIELALSRIKHTVPAKDYQGIMLVNPGGPGGKGRGLSVIGSLVPDGVGADYDWIGFDPRGVGDSKPSLSCDSAYTGYDRPAYVPAKASDEKAWLKKAAGYAAACAKAGGDLLEHLKTQDTVRDMDSIRQALGASKINFYGFSYGTYIGQVYATMYPQYVRRMILDGVVDPTRVWYASNLDQDIAFDRNIKIYFGWVAKYDKIYHLGRTEQAVERTFYREQAKLVAKPAAGVLGPDELTDVFLQAGYYVFGWEDIAKAFSAWVTKHDPAPLKKLYDTNNPQTKGADNGYAIYLGVQCSDVSWPNRWSQWRSDNWAVHRKAPFETWANAWYNAPCRQWAARPGHPTTVSGAAVPPILLLGESFDAATPFSGALETRRRFPKAALIEGVNGTTHAGSLFGDTCVDDAVSAYLADGTLPKRVKGARSDRKCDPLPQPNPGAPTPKRAPSADRAALERLLAAK